MGDISSVHLHIIQPVTQPKRQNFTNALRYINLFSSKPLHISTFYSEHLKSTASRNISRASSTYGLSLVVRISFVTCMDSFISYPNFRFIRTSLLLRCTIHCKIMFHFEKELSDNGGDGTYQYYLNSLFRVQGFRYCSTICLSGLFLTLKQGELVPLLCDDCHPIFAKPSWICSF